ncbi:hypothetical protein [Kaarinaea lacus]
MSGNNKFWCGFLDAGSKSSPVLLDDKLDTGNPKTVYMFNLKSERIIEYSRQIAEPKLRELKGDETSLLKELTKAYNKARKDFSPRTVRPSIAPSAAAPTPVKNTPSGDSIEDTFFPEDDDIDLDDELPTDDE